MYNKYRNNKTKGSDSKLESKRQQELILMQKAGEIQSLELQKDFKIFNGFHTEQHYRYEYEEAKMTNRGNLKRKKTVLTNKKHKVQDITYKADFYYFDNNLQKWVIEDAKGFQTADFKIKAKMVLELIKNMPDHVFFCNDYGFSQKVK